MADVKAGLFQKLMNNPQVMQMAEQMFNSMGTDQQNKMLNGKFYNDLAYHAGGHSTEEPLLASMYENPGAEYVKALAGNLEGGQNVIGSPSDLGSLALGAAKAHPFKTAGLIGMGAGNIGGLTDNDKFGGQLAGLGLGGLGAATLAQGNPYLQAVMTMGGGNLGALFDKLRARKEMEQSNIISPNQNTPRLPGLVY